MSRAKGFALVIVIWVMSLIMIMAASFAMTIRREFSIIETVKNSAETQALAETGLAIAQQMLLLDDPAQRWYPDGSIYDIHYLDAEIRVRLQDESGKIDINKADETLLSELIGQLPLALEAQQKLVSAILDWRDQDDLVRINGAEKKEYIEAGIAYPPANKNFQLVDELQMVIGMDTDSFNALKPLVTVYSGQQAVNMNLAPKEVLQAVGKLDETVLQDYLFQRVESHRAQLPPPQFPQIEGIANTGSAQNSKSGVYTVVSQARLNGAVGTGLVVTFKAHLQKGSTNAFKLLDWQTIDYNFSLFNEDMTQLLVTQQDEPQH